MLKVPVYLDSSAVVKLIADEPESQVLERFLRENDGQLTTSLITEIECTRAVVRKDPALAQLASRLLEKFIVLPLTESICRRAARLQPAELRSLDAIQLATVLELEAGTVHFVSYDRHLNDSARILGLNVETPTP